MLGQDVENEVSPEEVLQPEDVFEVLLTDDSRIKTVCGVLANDTGRAIINMLYEKPCCISELSKGLNLPPPLVTYHVSRLIEVGLLKISEGRSEVRKNRRISVYSPTKLGIFLIPKAMVERSDETFSKMREMALSFFMKKVLMPLSFVLITSLARPYLKMGSRNFFILVILGLNMRSIRHVE